MSALRKHICHIYKLDKGGEMIEYLPFHINMLNALEDVTGKTHTEVKIEEKSRTHWVAEYENASGQPRRVEIIATDEDINEYRSEFKRVEDIPGLKTVKGPKFK